MKFIKGISTALFVLVATGAFAQVPPPPNSGNNAPIDGAILLLAAAGAGYGAYKKMRK